MTGAGLGFVTPNVQGTVVPALVQDDFSLECWFSTAGGVARGSWWNDSPLIQGDVGGPAQDFGLSMTRDGRVRFGAAAAPATVTSPAGYNDGQWHHVVLTRVANSGAAVLYLDGVQVDQGIGETGSLDAPLVLGIGINTDIDTHTFEGTIDEVAQYDHVLSPDRVAYHHTRGSH